MKVRIIPGFVFLSLVVATSSGCLLKKIPAVNSQLNKYNQLRQRQIDKEIEGNEDYQRLALICGEIGSHQQFELLRRDMSVHGAPAVYYYYRSSLPFSMASAAITGLMERDGWHGVNNRSMNYTMAFEKDDLRIVVQYGGMGDADYGITCKVKSESDR